MIQPEMRGQVDLSERDLIFPRAKKRDLLASLLYRVGWLAFRRLGARVLRVELRFSRAIWRLTYEHAGTLYGDEFQNAILAIPAAPLEEWVPAGSRVLDMGCGNGRVTRLLAVHASEVLGIDRSPQAVALAHERTTAPNVTYQQRDMTAQLPETFDVAVLSHVLEHIDDVDALLGQLHENTSRLLVEVPQFGMDALNAVRRDLGVDYSSDADHVREYTREILEAQLTRNGWQPQDWVERPIALAVVATRA